MPPDRAVKTTSALSMQLRADGVMCDPNVTPTPTQTRLPPTVHATPVGEAYPPLRWLTPACFMEDYARL